MTAKEFAEKYAGCRINGYVDEDRSLSRRAPDDDDDPKKYSRTGTVVGYRKKFVDQSSDWVMLKLDAGQLGWRKSENGRWAHIIPGQTVEDDTTCWWTTVDNAEFPKETEQNIWLLQKQIDESYQMASAARLAEVRSHFMTESDLDRIGAVSGSSATACRFRSRI